MGVGRFFCVGLPLALTIASIIALLIATLSGVAHNQLWMFQLDTRNLSISPVDAAHLAGKAGLSLRDLKTDNITAADLNLADTYDVNLWGYCSTTRDGQRQCTKASFDWAATALNASVIETLNSTTGLKIELPHEMEAALRTFRTVTKWTEVAFIIALVALGLQLVVGIFAMCSRAVSCLTWLLSGVTGILVGVAAGMATAMATVVIGAVESSAKYYGVEGHVGGRFLATVWIAALFAIVSGLFWIFTVCCCKPERRQKRSKDLADGEKLLPTGAYKPISDHRVEMTGGQSGHPAYYDPNQAHAGYSSGPRHAAAQGRADMAYEPYSHRA